MIYLDNNASTLMLPDVRLRIDEVLSMRLANPASQHSPGRRARLLLENARDSIAASVDAHLQSVNTDLVLFTSGGTEANNLAILGLPQNPGAIVVSAIEHPSVLAAAEHAKSLGRVVRLLPVDSSGLLAWTSSKNGLPIIAHIRMPLIARSPW